MNNIYFCSDLHFGHNKPFLYEPRGFTSIELHDEQVIENWNSIIDESDTIYLLGDLVLGDVDYGIYQLSKLKGNIMVIRGNHDTNAKWERYAKEIPNITLLGYADVIKYKHYNFYLSHYPAIVSNYDSDKPLKQRMISLCGHSHTKDKFADMDKGLIYHVELDAHNNYPVDIETIINDIKEYIKAKS